MVYFGHNLNQKKKGMILHEKTYHKKSEKIRKKGGFRTLKTPVSNQTQLLNPLK
jgi:hypothetical protein